MPGSNIAFHIYAELDANEVTLLFSLIYVRFGSREPGFSKTIPFSFLVKIYLVKIQFGHFSKITALNIVRFHWQIQRIPTEVIKGLFSYLWAHERIRSALSQDEELRKQVWHPHIIQLSIYLTLRNQLPSRAYKKLDRGLC